MPKFIIAVEYSNCGEVTVEAETFEEAIGKVEDNPSIGLDGPDVYIDGSWCVNKQMTEHLNPEYFEGEDSDE